MTWHLECLMILTEDLRTGHCLSFSAHTRTLNWTHGRAADQNTALDLLGSMKDRLNGITNVESVPVELELERFIVCLFCSFDCEVIPGQVVGIAVETIENE